MAKLCVFCGSSETVDSSFKKIATDLGNTMAQRGVDLVYGGARVGLMGAVADAVLSAGGNVLGVLPSSLAGKELVHRELTELQLVGDLRERKRLLSEQANAFVALPGGIGTFDELFEVLVLRLIGEQVKPVALLDPTGYFDPLMALFDHGIGHGFIAETMRPARFDAPGELLDAFGWSTMQKQPSTWVNRA